MNGKNSFGDGSVSLREVFEAKNLARDTQYNRNKAQETHPAGRSDAHVVCSKTRLRKLHGKERVYLVPWNTFPSDHFAVATHRLPISAKLQTP